MDGNGMEQKLTNDSCSRHAVFLLSHLAFVSSLEINRILKGRGSGGAAGFYAHHFPVSRPPPKKKEGSYQLRLG